MFTGFSEDAIHFLTDIRLNNSPAFYEANRQRYEEYVKAPLRALCEEMTPVVQMIDPGLDTRPGRTMSRIRRDTRYSRDKSPFRDHVWLGWRYPGESRSEGFGLYWGFGPDWLSWGCGCYAADKPLMDALRLHIRRQPDEVRRVLHAAGAGYAMYGEAYRRIAVPEDVPEADACRATEIAQLCTFAKDMFRYWTRDPFASAFRRVLTLEQYRDADMARMLSQMLSAGPLEYVHALLAGRVDDPQEAALELYGPMFLLYSVYDGAQDDAQRQTVTAALDAHIDRFCAKWEGRA